MGQAQLIEAAKPVVAVTVGVVTVWWIWQQHTHRHKQGIKGESCGDSSQCGPGLGCVDNKCLPRSSS